MLFSALSSFASLREWHLRRTSAGVSGPFLIWSRQYSRSFREMASLTGMYRLTEEFTGRSQGYPYFRWKIRLTPDGNSELTREELLSGVLTELTDATLSGSSEIWMSLQRSKDNGEIHQKYLKTLSPTALGAFVKRFLQAHDLRRRSERQPRGNTLPKCILFEVLVVIR